MQITPGIPGPPSLLKDEVLCVSLWGISVLPGIDSLMQGPASEPTSTTSILSHSWLQLAPSPRRFIQQVPLQ